MRRYLLGKFNSYTGNVSSRSSKIVKNVILSFGVKLGSIIVGLLLMPMTIDYVNPIQYGVWLTLSSLTSWFNFFDIGMGNGLRNRLAECLTKGNTEEAQTYVATTYAVMAIIAVTLALIATLLNSFIDWSSVLNISDTMNVSVRKSMSVVFICFSIQLVTQLINPILMAVHQSALAGTVSFIGQLVVLIVIAAVKTVLPGTLELLALIVTSIPVLVATIYSIILFRTKLKHISPTFSRINVSFAKDVMTTGGAFFFVQLGALFLFQSNNIIISRVISPLAVTEYNIGYKLFSMANMVFTIIVTPLWSAYTEAYVSGDYKWMKQSLSKMRKIWLLLSTLTVMLLFLSNDIIKIWIGDSVIVPKSVNIVLAIYMIVLMWQTLHVYILNGLGKVRIQTFLVLVSAILNIPFSIYLGQLFGVAGIIVSNIIVFTVMGIIFYQQTKLILDKKAYGIWQK
ncbi:lipopolysaccharide biosynthesis protein [Dyadobacter jiangsuensis]